MHIIFGLINSFVFLVAFFIQQPKLKTTHLSLYIFLIVFMHVLLFGLNILQEIILLDHGPVRWPEATIGDCPRHYSS